MAGNLVWDEDDFGQHQKYNYSALARYLFKESSLISDRRFNYARQMDTAHMVERVCKVHPSTAKEILKTMVDRGLIGCRAKDFVKDRHVESTTVDFGIYTYFYLK